MEDGRGRLGVDESGAVKLSVVHSLTGALTALRNAHPRVSGTRRAAVDSTWRFDLPKQRKPRCPRQRGHQETGERLVVGFSPGLRIEEQRALVAGAAPAEVEQVLE